MEDAPGQIVNVPRVDKVNVGESQRNGSSRFGECSDVEIGSERNGSSNGGLARSADVFQSHSGSNYLAVDDRVLAKEDDLAGSRDHKSRGHWAGLFARRAHAMRHDGMRAAIGDAIAVDMQVAVCAYSIGHGRVANRGRWHFRGESGRGREANRGRDAVVKDCLRP